jgi:outer membrane receptor protein involved in Fe transport
MVPVPRRLGRRAAAPAALMALFSLGPAHAAPGPDEEPMRIESTIEVTAGDEQKTLEVPATVGTIDAKDVQRDNSAWIGETITRVPGVYMAQLRGPTDAPSIRFPVTYNNYYLYLQDNIPFQSPILYNHGAFSYSAAQSSFGGIEVLKGPGTALHGSDAIAAVINVRSREPEAKSFADGRLAGGSYGFYEGRGEGNLAWGKNAIIATAGLQHDDGWRDNSAWSRGQTVVRHRYLSDAGASINTMMLYTDNDSEMSGPVSEETMENDPTNAGLQPGVPLDEAVNHVNYLRLNSEVLKPFGTRSRLSVTPYYRRLDSDYLAVWFPDSTPRTDTLDQTAGVLARFYFQGQGRTETVFGLDYEHTWVDLVEEQSRPDTVVFGFFESPKGLHYDYSVTYRGLAPYVQHTQALGEKAVLTAGLRYDDLVYDYDNHAETPVFGSYFRPDDRRDEFSSWNPKLGVSYFVTPNNTVYSRYAHSFRIPSAYDLYNLDTSQAESTLKPEKVDSIEVGYKGSPARRIRVEASAYLAKARDGITTTTTPAGDLKTNGGKTDYRGIELGFGADVGSGVSFDVAYAYSHHEIVRLKADSPSPEDGNVVPSAPFHLINLRLDWRPQGLEQVLISPEMMYLGDWYLDNANTQKKGADAVLNLRASYDLTERYALSVKVLNIFDRIYPSTAEDAGFGAQYRVAQRRTVVGGVDFRF